MKIQDFCDMNKFEQIMSNWAKSTGLATVAVGDDGKYISDFLSVFPARVMHLQYPKSLDYQPTL